MIIGIISIVISALVSILIAYITSKATNKQHKEKIEALKSVAMIQIDSELAEIKGKRIELIQQHQHYIEKLDQIERQRKEDIFNFHHNPNFDQIYADREDKEYKMKLSKSNLDSQLALLAGREAKLIEAKEKLINK